LDSSTRKKERFDPVKDEDYWNLINLPEYIDEYGTFLDYFEELLNELGTGESPYMS